jgi:RND family efflux transporter MFP subunit
MLDTPEVESDAKSARARANEAELNAKLSLATAQRYQRLAEAGADSFAQADQFEAQANSAAIDTSRAAVSRADTLLSFRFVRAPFSGVITRRNVGRGTLVSAGSTSGVNSLFEIVRTETLKVLVDVPQALASSVHVGDEVLVDSDGRSAKGRIARTSKALDAATRTLRVEIHVPGDQGILAGAFVRARFNVEYARPPVLVGANSLSLRADGTFVFVLDDNNRAQLVKIEIGRDLGAEIEVASGLSGSE